MLDNRNGLNAIRGQLLNVQKSSWPENIEKKKKKT